MSASPKRPHHRWRSSRSVCCPSSRYREPCRAHAPAWQASMPRDNGPQAGLGLARVSHAFAQRRVVDEVSLTVPPGTLVCLVGPSGCGKTTLLRLAAGLETLQSGTVSVDGTIVAEPGRVSPPERRGIGMVFQD